MQLVRQQASRDGADHRSFIINTATTAAPTTTTQPQTTSEIGKTKPFNGDDGTYKTNARIGVLEYSDNAVLPSYRNEPDLTRPGCKFVAIQVRFCLVSTNYPDDVSVNWATWVPKRQGRDHH
jgi:hypothetical protein